MALQFAARLYPIVDWDACGGRDVVGFAAKVIAGGAPLLQLRVKQQPTRDFLACARAVQRIAAARGAQLIINDRADLAVLVAAAGVHLGQDDLSPEDVRGWLGPRRIIGLSTHSLAQVESATRAGVADYLGFGPVFATANKRNPDAVQGVARLAAVCAATPLPVVAIGGIDAARYDEVLRAGATAVAMIGGLTAAADPEGAVRDLLGRSPSAPA